MGLIQKNTPLDLGNFQHLLHMCRQIFANPNKAILDSLRATFEKNGDIFADDGGDESSDGDAENSAGDLSERAPETNA